MFRNYGLIKMVLVVLAWFFGSVIASMFVVGADTHLESDGDAVNVDLTATVTAKQVALVEGWLGITGTAGESGDTIALDISPREYQFTVPTALAVVKGDKIYIEVADLTGHTPDDTAYSKTAGAGKVLFFKATSDQDDNDLVFGILCSKFN
jgi:hypothetical protein